MEQIKNKKLRLVVTDKCHNKCPLCCNNRFDLRQLPVVDRWNYDEIMITGGEPLLFVEDVVDLVRSIREIQRHMGIAPSKFYLYTALPATVNDTALLIRLGYFFDGMCITPHTERDVELFKDLLFPTKASKALASICSMRLNLFADANKMLEDSNIDFTGWKIKHMEWIKDCPVPEGEDLRRINNLFG